MTNNVKLFGVYTDAATESAALKVLRSGQIAGGHYSSTFPKAFGELVDQENIVTVNDMSNAIQIALRLANIKSGDEVLTTSFACMSTNAPIITAGGIPKWVDVDAKTGLMCPHALERAISSKSKAVLVYHLAGYPAKIEEIAAICKRRGLVLIEDCDNAMLARVNGRQVGTFGDFAIFSFYPNRQINATEGGALSCLRAKDAGRAIKLRRYGIDLTRFRDSDGEIDQSCDVPEIGWPATLNNLCSAIAFAQLTGVEERIQQGRVIADLYRAKLSLIEGIEIVEPYQSHSPSYWAFLIRVKNRDHILAQMKKSGIMVSKLHHRTDLYSGFGVSAANLRVAQVTKLETICHLQNR